MGNFRRSIALALASCALAALGGCDDDKGGSDMPMVPGGTPTPSPTPAPSPTPSPTPTPTPATSFTARAIVSNVPGLTTNQDPNLSHGWGIAFGGGPVWVADHASNKSTLYDGNGVANALVVSIPANAAGRDAGPTGIVFNPDAAFTVSKNGVSGTAAFLFDGTGGTISAWSPAVDRNNAVTVYDGSAAGDVFTGLAILSGSADKFLYAANFSQGRVDVFDPTYAKVTTAGGFVDPNLPSGYVPYGIQAIGGQIYVTYARRTPGQPVEDRGAGLGLVNVFNASGTLLKRLVSPGGALNAPWGVAIAPAGWGEFGGDVLIGNFGDGRINAYSPITGAFVGTLTDSMGAPIVLPGLWGIAFGNDAANQPKNTLYYAAGPTVTEGVYGRVDVNP